ncbi:MAG: S8 family serine peptidase [Burkholderiales bacterium]|nr:S8 family serine peptidase [Burkholderiales bacterium]
MSKKTFFKSARCTSALLAMSPLALAAALSLPAQAMQGSGGQAQATPQSGEHTDRMIVRYRHQTSNDVVDLATLGSADRAARRAGATVRHLRRTGSGSHVLQFDQRLSVARARQLAAEIKAADPLVEYAEPDRIMKPQFLPNDPQFSAQWHYHEPVAGINLPAAWDKSTGSGVTVAVIDTGYRPHADLAANIVAGYDFISLKSVSNDGNGRDTSALDMGDAVKAGECGAGSPAQGSSWHGTHVAGTIAAVTGNGVGVAGVAFGAKVQPVRVLGKCGGYTSDIADAVIWASGGVVPGAPVNATPARVINMSLGGAGACDTTWQNAINGARSRNTVVVVSAGNSGANASGYAPASCTGVITVGSVGRSGARAFYSNYGALVDVSAPGGDQSFSSADGVFSTLNSGSTRPGTDSYAYYQGTSMAAPHVAGVVALMLARNPALTPDDVEVRLKASARPLPVTCTVGCGAGIVDASAAVDAALDPPPPPSAGPAPAPSPAPAPAAPAPQRAEVEPNDSLANAQVLTGATTVNGSLAVKTDTDHYRVSIAPGKSLVVRLAPSATSDYDLWAYNSAGVRVSSSTNGTGQIETITLSNSSTTASSIAYLRVVYFAGGLGATNGKYSLTVQ